MQKTRIERELRKEMEDFFFWTMVWWSTCLGCALGFLSLIITEFAWVSAVQVIVLCTIWWFTVKRFECTENQRHCHLWGILPFVGAYLGGIPYLHLRWIVLCGTAIFCCINFVCFWTAKKQTEAVKGMRSELQS